MQLNKHGSFYIRSGWPTKIIDAIAEDKYVFSAKNELAAVDAIGVGRVMVKSMRYWTNVLGIACEAKDQTGVYFDFSPLGLAIQKYDLFCQLDSTLWLLHRNVAIAEEEATAWYWLFNEFRASRFTKDGFTNALFSYAQNQGSDYSQRAVEKEFDCVKNTYLREEAFTINQVIEENTIPFFAPLRLLEKDGDAFVRRKIKASELPLDVLLYFIVADNQERLLTNTQLSIDMLMESEKQLCKYVNFSYASLIEALQKLDTMRKITLHNNFGNRYITVPKSDCSELLTAIYNDNMR